MPSRLSFFFEQFEVRQTPEAPDGDLLALRYSTKFPAPGDMAALRCCIDHFPAHPYPSQPDIWNSRM